jgi:SAM-dependent methyltransferase
VTRANCFNFCFFFFSFLPWLARGKPYECSFFECSDFGDISQYSDNDDWVDKIASASAEHGGCDVVFSNACLGQVFDSEQQLRTFLASVARILKPGGVFIGILDDSSQIWTRAQKTHAKNVENNTSKRLRFYFLLVYIYRSIRVQMYF